MACSLGALNLSTVATCLVRLYYLSQPITGAADAQLDIIALSSLLAASSSQAYLNYTVSKKTNEFQTSNAAFGFGITSVLL